MKTSDVTTTFFRVYFNLDWNRDQHVWETGVDYEAAQFAKKVGAYRVEKIVEKAKEWRTVERVDLSKIKH
jgi:hypothetical protein